MNRFNRIFIILFLLLFPIFTFASDISIIPNTKFKNAIPTTAIIDTVKKTVDLSANANVLKAKVQVIYDSQSKPDYLLVYLLSAKNYSLTITKIKVNADFKVIAVIPHYHLQKQDLSQQPNAGRDLSQLNCPDETVNFVSATPCDYIHTAKEAIEYVATQATSNGYVTRTMLGNEATVDGYISWMTCPNLKGFFNVGHGNDSGILLDDGFLSNKMIHDQLAAKLAGRTVVLFNSCEVMNDPLKSTLIEDANAQKYAGGVTTLWIGPSELASRCFWDAAFKQENMTPALANCNQKFDPSDIFGIEGHGTDVLNR